MSLQEKEAEKQKMLAELSAKFPDPQSARKALHEAYAMGARHMFNSIRSNEMECGCLARNDCGPICDCLCHQLGRNRAPHAPRKLTVVKKD